MNLKHIIIGWLKAWKIMLTTDEEQSLSEKRLAQCKKCTSSSPSTIVKILNGKVKHEHALVCEICHCPCLEKSLVLLEKCPKNLWPR